MITVQDKTDGQIGYASRSDFDNANRYVFVADSVNGSRGQYILRGNLQEVSQ
jgi:hypothetical protein